MWREVLTLCVLAALLLAPVAEAQYRDRGVVVSDYYMDDGRCYITVDIYERCSRGSFELTIRYDDYGHSKTRTARGSWSGGASSETVTVYLTRDSEVRHVAVTRVQPDC